MSFFFPRRLLCCFASFTFCALLTTLTSAVFAKESAPTKALLDVHPEIDAAIQVLDAWIEHKAFEEEMPGLSIGIVHDQKLIWAKGYGHGNIEQDIAASPKTLYRIASITKLFTSTAILQLRDAGKLQLDDPVTKHLPWFGIQGGDDNGETITVRHLLTHTSGLPREATGMSWNVYTFPTPEEMKENISKQDRNFPKENTWQYSNMGMAVLGELIAKLSGKPWEVYIENHILKPLGMNSTHPLPTADLPGMAIGYGRRARPGAKRGHESFVDLGAERPAGNMASNVEDLARFVSLQFRDAPTGGEQILKGATLREMHRVHWLRRDWKQGWGLGFSVRRVGRQVRVGHGGSLPGHRTQIELAPKDKLGVIVLTNAYDGVPQLYVNKAFSILNPAMARAKRMPSPELPNTPEVWKKYVGRYSWKHQEMRIMVLGDKLGMIYPASDTPWKTRINLKPIGKHTFLAIPANEETEPPGEPRKFTFDDAGNVKHFGTFHFHWLRNKDQ